MKIIKNWSVLNNKRIVELIIGDKEIKSDVLFDYKMPYMTKNSIILFGNKLGFHIDTDMSELSRTKYMNKIIDYVITENHINNFFKELFNLKRFESLIDLNHYKDSNEMYWYVINEFMIKVNQILFFDNCHIEYNFNKWRFILIDDFNNVKIETKEIERINHNYVKRLKNEIYNTLNDGDYESTISKSKTLIEEILKYGIITKGKSVLPNIKFQKLYFDFKNLYNLMQNESNDRIINNLLSGFEKILISIVEMRNLNSDSHGIGIDREKMEKSIVTLFANSSIILSNFFISIIDSNNSTIN